MARKVHHEEHQNHEAWAIPYGDLVTLLLAFFVVMYAVSSINEGKYRVLSDALSKAFGGPPKSLRPLQMGRQSQRGAANDARMTAIQSERVDQSVGGTMRQLSNPQVIAGKIRTMVPQHQINESGNTGYKAARQAMDRMAADIEKALSELIKLDLVTVRRTELWLEVEVKTDILFASGSAALAQSSRPAMRQIAATLQPFPNRIRVEGYTDNVPIRSRQFPSNWELSSARAAGVVHEFIAGGIAPGRLTVAGFGEFHPAGDNATPEGRTRNRRVLIVVLTDASAAKDWMRQQGAVPEALPEIVPGGESAVDAAAGVEPLPPAPAAPASTNAAPPAAAASPPDPAPAP